MCTIFKSALLFCASLRDAICRDVTASQNTTQQTQHVLTRTPLTVLTCNRKNLVKKKHPNQTNKAQRCRLRRAAVTTRTVITDASFNLHRQSRLNDRSTCFNHKKHTQQVVFVIVENVHFLWAHWKSDQVCLWILRKLNQTIGLCDLFHTLR